MSEAIKSWNRKNWTRESKERTAYAAYREQCECCKVLICQSLRQHLEMKHNCKECERYARGECPHEDEVKEILEASERGVPSTT